MSEHTPAPWAFHGPRTNIHVCQADDPNMRICFMTSDGPTVANARLIAAAPDLLDLAKNVQVTRVGADLYVGLIVPGLGFCSAKVSTAFNSLALEWEQNRNAIIAKAMGVANV